MTIKKIDDADVADYTLKLTNKCGECKTDFTVSIIGKRFFIISIASDTLNFSSQDLSLKLLVFVFHVLINTVNEIY